MGIQDRPYYGDSGEGRIRRALRRIASGEDSFLSWAVPLYTAWGIRVRVHLLFILLVVGELIQSAIRSDVAGVGFVAYGMAALFVLVLLHEYGHCFACRWVGGEADRILMWPLGGLASCAPPHTWQANLITTLGGPGVNVVLVPVLGAALVAIGVDWQALLMNPFDPVRAIVLSNVTGTAALLALWLYQMNLSLLLFNMLLPMYPMDCSRMLHAVLWKFMGYERSLGITVNLGLFTAIIVGTWAFISGKSMLAGVAIFSAFECVNMRRQLRFMSSPYGQEFQVRPAGPSPGEVRKRQKQAEAVAKHQAEVDRILEKIRDHGMQSLSRGEKKTLEKETELKRGR